MKKKLLIGALLIALSSATYAYTSYRGCSGGKNCTACKNCSGCKNCAKNGGTCSVCKR